MKAVKDQIKEERIYCILLKQYYKLGGTGKDIRQQTSNI